MTTDLSRTEPLRVLALTGALTAVLGRPVRSILIASSVMDHPNERSSHITPVPRGGGIAALVGAGLATSITHTPLQRRTVTGILTLAGLGFADDITGHVPAVIRLGGQFVVGISAFALHRADYTIGAVTTAGIVNVVNFMDGINGITGLTAVVWGVHSIFLEGANAQLNALGALTAGVGLGFLPYNLRDADLFLGDVGSYSIGAAIAAGVLGQETMATRYRAAAPLFLYGIDAFQALVGRALKRHPLGHAHREHIYQRLVDQGHAHEQVAIVHAAGATMLALAARLPPRSSILLSSATALAYLSLPRLGRASILAPNRPTSAT